MVRHQKPSPNLTAYELVEVMYPLTQPLQRSNQQDVVAEVVPRETNRSYHGHEPMRL